MMSSELLKIIQTKTVLTDKITDIVIQELLTPNFFSSDESEIVAKWYAKLSLKERDLLLESDKLCQALEFDFNRDECCVFSATKIDKMFSQTTYRLMPRTINWLKNNIFFPKIKLPSGVQIQTDAEAFFKTLADGLDVFPHLIDELKRGASFIPCLYMVPCNYKEILGSCRLNSFQIKLKNDTYNEDVLKNILHEIGHASAVPFRKKQENVLLINFTDEAEQYAKTTYIELFQENLEDNPLLDLGQYIYKQLRQKYPTLSDEKIERATAILTKREIIWLHLLRNEQLHFLLEKWREDGILDGKTNFSYDYAQLIAYRWDFYTQWYSISQSLYKDKENFKNQLIKRYGEPKLITKYLSKRDLLSGDFCAELMGRAGYVDVPTESLKPFHLERVYFKPKNHLIFKTYIDCTGFSLSTMEKMKQVYADYGVQLKRRKNQLYADSFTSTNQVYKLIYNDFSNAPICLGHSFFKIDRKQLSPQVDEELSKLFEDAPITTIADEDIIIVDKVQLEQYGYTFDAPIYGGCIWQVEGEFLDDKKINSCLKRWQQKGFHPSWFPLTEKYVLFLFPEKEIDCLKAYLKKVQFASFGLKSKRQPLEGIPNPINAKLRKNLVSQKNRVRE